MKWFHCFNWYLHLWVSQVKHCFNAVIKLHLLSIWISINSLLVIYSSCSKCLMSGHCRITMCNCRTSLFMFHIWENRKDGQMKHWGKKWKEIIIWDQEDLWRVETHLRVMWHNNICWMTRVCAGGLDEFPVERVQSINEALMPFYWLTENKLFPLKCLYLTAETLSVPIKCNIWRTNALILIFFANSVLRPQQNLLV